MGWLIRVSLIERAQCCGMNFYNRIIPKEGTAETLHMDTEEPPLASIQVDNYGSIDRILARGWSKLLFSIDFIRPLQIKIVPIVENDAVLSSLARKD
jgi:hypothetical protein